jgi:hypothetical protein
MRTALIALAVAAVSLGATAAYACEGGCPCARKHAEKKTDANAKVDAAKKAPDAKPAEADKKTPATAEEKARQGSLPPNLEQLMADKCSCSSASDCTCKKGTCKCPKCNGAHKQHRMIESLKGADPLRIPETAHSDATAGVFI